jgi:2-phospho-L-lactate/phosphoenolpyruvate guanylyltransferase
VTAAVLVPIKAFTAAKGRLDGTLDAVGRAELARTLAAGVIAAAAPLPVLVVCDDDEVAEFATARRAGVLRQQAPGLNAAVAEGVDHLAAQGVRRVVVAHADLPRPSGLASLAAGDGVTLVPDRDDDGTNVLVVPAAGGFRFAYGPGSFAAHLAEAERLGLTATVVRDDDLAWDVDTAEDLAGLE